MKKSSSSHAGIKFCLHITDASITTKLENWLERNQIIDYYDFPSRKGWNYIFSAELYEKVRKLLKLGNFPAITVWF